jgi:membrane protease YdiL (CAAX protease family)
MSNLVPNSTHSNRATGKPWRFFGLTLGWSWLCYWLAAWLSRAGSSWLVNSLHALGGIAPLVVALFLIYRSSSDVKSFVRRMIDVAAIPSRWYLVIFTAVPLVSAAAAILDILAGGWGLRLEEASRLLTQPALILPYLLFTLFFGPFPEEPGWRGYALDALLTRFNFVNSSLLIGFFWALWHIPLFFVIGSYQSQLGLGTPAFWMYLFMFPVTSIVYTWIVANTGGSILAAILFHFMQNLTGELFELSARADQLAFGLWLILALGLAVLFSQKSIAGPDLSSKEQSGRSSHGI